MALHRQVRLYALNTLNKVLVNNKLKSVSNKEVKNLIGNGAKALIIDSFNKQNTKIKRYKQTY